MLGDGNENDKMELLQLDSAVKDVEGRGDTVEETDGVAMSASQQIIGQDDTFDDAFTL